METVLGEEASCRVHRASGLVLSFKDVVQSSSDLGFIAPCLVEDPAGLVVFHEDLFLQPQVLFLKPQDLSSKLQVRCLEYEGLWLIVAVGIVPNVRRSLGFGIADSGH